MTTRIQSIHFDADQKLLNLIEEKLLKIGQKLGLSHAEADVILKLERNGQIQDKIVEVIVNIPGQHLVAKSSGKSFEGALRVVSSSIRSQLLKYKERIQRKH